MCGLGDDGSETVPSDLVSVGRAENLLQTHHGRRARFHLGHELTVVCTEVRVPASRNRKSHGLIQLPRGPEANERPARPAARLRSATCLLPFPSLRLSFMAQAFLTTLFIYGLQMSLKQT